MKTTKTIKLAVTTALVLFATAGFSQKKQELHQSKIDGVILNRQDLQADSIFAEVFDVYQFGVRKYYSILDKEGRFHFDVNFSNPIAKINIGFFENKKLKTICYERLIEPGDHITIEVNDEDDVPRVVYQGKNKIKYACEDSLKANYKTFANDKSRLRFGQEAKKNGNYVKVDSFFVNGYSKLIRTLERFKDSLSTNAYNFYSAENVNRYFGNSLLFMYLGFKDTLNVATRKQIKNEMLSYSSDLKISINQDVASLSTDYLEYLLQKEQYNLYVISEGVGFEFKALYHRIKDKFKGILRERLLTYFLGNYSRYTFVINYKEADYSNVLTEAKSIIKIAPFQDLLTLHTKLSPGAVAFNFSLQDTAGKTVSLSDFKGNVVLIDVWGEGCTGCAIFYAMFEKEVAPRLAGRNFKVVSISIDRSKTGWLRGIKSNRYTNAHNINLNTGGLVLDHPFTQFYNIQAIPFLLLIDKEGKVVAKIEGSMSGAEVYSLINDTLNHTK